MATSAAAPFVRCLLPRPPSSLSSSQKAKDGTPCTSGSNKRSRLVLLQHTADLTTRLTASSPADASASDGSGSRKGGRRVGTSRKVSSDTISNSNATSEDALYRLAGLRTPSESATRDLAGHMLALSALEEVASRTGGRVVWVSLANNLSVPSRSYGDGGTAHALDDSVWAAQLQRNGATVDLASDPLGWDESDDEEDGENKEEDDGAPSTTHRWYSSRMDSLKAVLATIERAAASIPSTDDGNGNEATRDIPVIFDSIIPLLSYHGSAKTYRFLQRLLGRGTVGNNINGASNNIALSPIVAPISIESIQPADMRRFEDEADAIVTLSGGEMRTMRRGGGDGKVGGAAGRLGTDVQQFSLEQNQLQKQQQQQQPGATGLGYKSAERLVLLKLSGQSDKEERKKVVVQRKTKARNDASGGDESLLPTTAEKLASMELASSTSQAPSASSSSSQRSRPTLQIEEGRDTANSAAATKATAGDHSQSQPTSKSGPRIFVQDDDPEFDDMDEEDLDDDLDL